MDSLTPRADATLGLPRERHAFLPGASGTVCVARRTLVNVLDSGEREEIEIFCGYPRSHPFHGPLDLDLSPQPAPLRTDAVELRAHLIGLAEHAHRAPLGDALVAARIDEMVRRWGSERPA